MARPFLLVLVDGGEAVRKRRSRWGEARAKRWKDAAWDRGERRCALCGEEITYFCDASVDHIVPTSIGGLDKAENFQMAHRDCNTEKSNKEDWHEGEQVSERG